jgi:hypothetical protein
MRIVQAMRGEQLRSWLKSQACGRLRCVRVMIIALAALVTAALPAGLPAATGGLSAAAQQELLDHDCRSGHNDEESKGGVTFEIFDPSQAHEDAALAERMLRKLRAGMKPPAGKPRPDAATVQAFATSLETEIDAHAHPDRHGGVLQPAAVHPGAVHPGHA